MKKGQINYYIIIGYINSMLQNLDIMKYKQANNRNVNSRLYFTNKVYITNNKRISNKLINL